jgi:beta-glucosidase
MPTSTFRDLNKNGVLDPYEDATLPVETRVEDLLAQMTLEEKAGLMFHAMIPLGADGKLVEGMGMAGPWSTRAALFEQHLTHFNIYASSTPRAMAEWYNALQKLAEQTRLGIPVTISTDPRHGFNDNVAANLTARHFSQWPESVGLAATGDDALVREFGDIARQEYLAVGIRVALHPMADLATEPRWARINGTFGEDAALSSRMLSAYIKGFQGETPGAHSVACMTKHFPGGGPQLEGRDSHFSFGKEQVYPGNNFDYHLIPFAAAFAAGTSQIMPYYGQPIGTELEPVGFGFSHGVITGMLRGRYGFDGIVCGDWRLLTDVVAHGKVIIEAKAWGVEHLTPLERCQRAIEAGLDQFGGETCVELVIELVRSRRVSEARIDESARRILREKFKLGLFDNPFVDVDAAERIVGSPEFVAKGALAQRKAFVLLKNGDDNGTSGAPLPLGGRPRLYVEGVDPAVAADYAEVVDTPAEANLALIRLKTPYQPREGLLESLMHDGDLDFKGEALEHVLALCRQVPTVVDINLERPAVIPEIAAQAVAVLANFGASDAALLDIVFGRFAPTGKLPFEMPSSMAAVCAQKEDMPYDSESPLFKFGHGLQYGENS